jgi:glutathione S-transferase
MSKVLQSKDNFEAAKEESFTKGGLKNKLDILNKNLEGKEWLTGFLSIADFLLVEFLDLVTRMDPARLEPYLNLRSLQKRFAEIPEIKAHRESDKFVKLWYLPGIYAWTDAEEK